MTWGPITQYECWHGNRFLNKEASLRMIRMIIRLRILKMKSTGDKEIMSHNIHDRCSIVSLWVSDHSQITTTKSFVFGLGNMSVFVTCNEDMTGFPWPGDSCLKFLVFKVLDQWEKWWRYRQPKKSKDWLDFGHDP